ncbi:hypothetical protein KR222_007820 [Zaprionus bogoriensis]|nr:hypothetical protein KR222_007820 [Zaprionus bogoriensis]
MAKVNFYELLNATTTATFEELKRNYKQLILQCHPDKLQQQQQQNAVTVNSEESDPNIESDNNNFNAINEAWTTLKDPIKRKHYDAELLQTKFQTHSNIYATITLNDMQRTRVECEEEPEGGEHAEADSSTDKETATTSTATSASASPGSWSFAYAYNCRCGGQYLLDDESAAEQRDRLGASEMIVECSECSLVVIVKPQ